MSGFRPFVRQLGYQPGVQLNPLADTTDGAAPDNSDQVFAMVGRFTRGRIDRPFRVNRSNFLAKTGPAEAIRTNALNEAKLQAFEAITHGAYEGVLMRLTTTSAAKSFALVRMDTAVTTFGVAAALSGASYSLALLHHDCHNDGIKVAVHADVNNTGGIPVVNPYLMVRVLTSDGATVLHEFIGSVDPDAKDDFGKSAYLPDIVARTTESVELIVNTSFAGVLTTSDAYGRGSDNKDKWLTSGVLQCFSEGGTTYLSADYDRCINGLRQTTTPFGYILSGGTQVLALLSKLASFAVEANMPMLLDFPGALPPAAVLTMDASLNLDTHYVFKYWAPLESEDPLSGARSVFGASGYITGYACRRNANVNAKGFAPKNVPIAGKEYPIERESIRQIYKPEEQDLSDLAKAQINPVIFELYNGGGKYVPTDCLTAAKTRVSYKKLTTVAEMSSTLDNWVSMYAKEIMMLPMEIFISKMKKFLQKLLEDAEASKWLTPAKNLPNNAAFAFVVQPSEIRPADLVLITYNTSFDGVARQAILQQILTS